MIKSFSMQLLCLALPFLFFTQQSTAQDKLTYVLKVADVDVVDGSKVITVRFQGSFPDDGAAEDETNWRVIAIDENGQTKSYEPANATIPTNPLLRASKLVHLRMAVSLEPGDDLDPKTHKIIVRYQQQNLPSS